MTEDEVVRLLGTPIERRPWVVIGSDETGKRPTTIRLFWKRWTTVYIVDLRFEDRTVLTTERYELYGNTRRSKWESFVEFIKSL